MFCYKCGYELQDGTDFCRKCGSKNVFSDLTPNEKKSKQTKSKQSKFKNFIILGVLILLLTIGFGGYYISVSNLFSNNSNNSKETSTKNKITSNDSTTNKTTITPNIKSEDAKTENKPDTNKIESIDSYILPESQSEKLLDSDVSVLNKENLTLARNEIYARHGFIFKSEPYKSYFLKKSWYKPNPNFDGKLDNVETANIKLISKYENN
ncbi:YARHG domain-containing protein [Clostridium sp.]|jgi:ribosomal protein L40E|uniref:YARHG domain-containing protein n=1 Tax=Clostridium sp. TaxID=1506 RepID=UPI003EE91C38